MTYFTIGGGPVDTSDIKAKLGFPAIGTAADQSTAVAGASDVAFPSVLRVRNMIEGWGYTTLRPFGGVPDSNTSGAKIANSAALSDALEAGVRSLHIGDGDWWFGSALTKTISHPFRLEGCGRTATRLFFDTGDAGAINLTQTEPLAQITVSGLSLASSSTTGTGNGLSLSFPATVSGTFPTARVFDVGTLGIDIFNHAFGSSLVLSQAWNAQLSDLHLTGARGAGKARLMKNGIVGSNCTGISVSQFKIYSSTEGVVLGGGITGGDTIDEGFQITDFEIVDVDRGIYHATQSAHAGSGIHNGHINAERVCIDLYAKHNTEVSDVGLYKLTQSTQNWTGIKAQNCNGCHFHDIVFVDSSLTNSGANFGLFIVGSSENTIHHLRNTGVFSGLGGIVVVGAGSEDNDISHITGSRLAGVPAVVVQAGAGLYNRYSSLSPSGFQTLAANSTTPSIANDLFGVWSTANTATTAITNFTGGYGTQTLTVKINDTNTTLTHNANLILKGFVNATPPNGGLMTFVLDGTTWRETARSF